MQLIRFILHIFLILIFFLIGMWIANFLGCEEFLVISTKDGLTVTAECVNWLHRAIVIMFLTGIIANIFWGIYQLLKWFFSSETEMNDDLLDSNIDNL